MRRLMMLAGVLALAAAACSDETAITDVSAGD